MVTRFSFPAVISTIHPSLMSGRRNGRQLPPFCSRHSQGTSYNGRYAQNLHPENHRVLLRVRRCYGNTTVRSIEIFLWLVYNDPLRRHGTSSGTWLGIWPESSPLLETEPSEA